MSNRLFVVTGGPGSGKTTLIEALARQAIRTVPEAGRAIIRDQLGRGGRALPWADRAAYADLMFEREVRAHREAAALPGPVVLDRGIPDVIGYLTLCGLPVPDRMEAAAARYRYNGLVFLAPFWGEIFLQDAERRQDSREAEATCRIMAATYRRLGYRIAELPLAGVEARAAFVAERLAGGMPPPETGAGA